MKEAPLERRIRGACDGKVNICDILRIYVRPKEGRRMLLVLGQLAHYTLNGLGVHWSG